MIERSATELANTVTAYATILGGLLPLLLTWLTRPQPRRWVWVYWAMVVTGVATVWYHGYGETFAAGTADNGTNLLLAWMVQLAVLGDYYSKKARLWVGGISGLVNLGVIIWRIWMGVRYQQLYALPLGEFGGFFVGEVLLIVDSLFAVILMYIRFADVPRSARPLWILATVIFLLGAAFASASNHQVDFGVLAYHATWHLISAFGFLVIWVFNYTRALGKENQMLSLFDERAEHERDAKSSSGN